MADEEREQRTEQATPRRRLEARERGQVPISLELTTALLLCAWAGALAAGGGRLARTLGSELQGSFARLADLGRDELSVRSAAQLVADAGFGAARPLLMLLLPLWVIGALVAYVQIGFQVTPKAVAADLARLDPFKGLGRLFSARTTVRTLLALGKLLFIAAAMAGATWSQIEEIASLSGSDLGPLLAGLGHVALRCAAGGLLAVLLLSLADAVFQRWQHERDLRMSRQEVREELKNLEGDPHIRARIRRLQRELATRRQLAEVPKATVVVTNPTHFAVALRYQREGGRVLGAPRVVAKGVERVAQRIGEIAREAGVICYEDVALARALHARCEIGDEIPLDLYQAVAEVLAYVYRVQGAGALAQRA